MRIFHIGFHVIKRSLAIPGHMVMLFEIFNCKVRNFRIKNVCVKVNYFFYGCQFYPLPRIFSRRIIQHYALFCNITAENRQKK